MYNKPYCGTSRVKRKSYCPTGGSKVTVYQDHRQHHFKTIILHIILKQFCYFPEKYTLATSRNKPQTEADFSLPLVTLFPNCALRKIEGISDSWGARNFETENVWEGEEIESQKCCIVGANLPILKSKGKYR